MKHLRLKNVSTYETYAPMEHPIADYRNKNRLTQEAFGRLVGGSKGMVSKWESCRVLPRPQIIQRIEDVTDRQVDASSIVRAFNAASLAPEAAE